MGITITGGLSFSGGLTVISPVTGASGSSWIAYLYDAAVSNTQDLGITNLAVDPTGNVYAGGYQYRSGFNGTGLFVKYSTDGVVQWGQDVSSTNTTTRITGVSLLGTQPVFGGYRESPSDLLLGACNTAGSLQWSRAIGSALYEVNDANGRSISIDSAGNIFLVGQTYTSAPSDSNFFIAKYNSSGVLQWQRTLGRSNVNEYQFSTATDSTGAVYIVGSTNSLDAGSSASYIAKYDSSGTLLWQRYIGNSNANYGRSVATDGSDNVFLLTNSDISSPYSQYGNVAKYDSSGTLQWQKNITADGYGVEVNALATDSAGNVYVTGNYNTLSFVYTIVVKFDNSGTHQWSRYMGITNGRQFNGRAVQVDTSGNYYVAHEYYPDNYPTGRVKAFITKLPTNGTRTGTYSAGGISFTYGTVSLTIGNGTLTGGTPSLSSNTGSLTDAAANLAASTSTFSTTTTTIASS